MIVSNDSIIRSPYDIDGTVLKLLISISEKIREINLS